MEICLEMKTSLRGFETWQIYERKNGKNSQEIWEDSKGVKKGLAEIKKGIFEIQIDNIFFNEHLFPLELQKDRRRLLVLRKHREENQISYQRARARKIISRQVWIRI